MKIADGIHMLEIEAVTIGAPTHIYPTLLQSGSDVILVDSGYPGQNCYPKILQELHHLGIDVQDITRVILTHQDLDHIGGLPPLLKDNPSIEVICHEAEKPYVEGEKKLVKISRSAGHNLDHLPEHLKNAFLQVFQNPPTAPVHATVKDGQTLPFCGGITVIHMPGHTPGNICLYIQDARLLIAGDSLTAQDGVLYGPVPEHAQDIGLAKQSLSKLAGFNIESIVCYHGGWVKDGGKQLQSIIKKNNRK